MAKSENDSNVRALAVTVNYNRLRKKQRNISQASYIDYLMDGGIGRR